MRVVGIVQARLGSQRLAGKVLKELCGWPMLEHVMERLKHADTLDEIVVAIPSGAEDEPLVAWCKTKGYSVYAGSENDLIARYLEAARAFNVDAVMRVTSDCPLIDPAVVDGVVERHLRSSGNEYTCNVLIRSFPRGMDTEVLSRECLERLGRETQKPIYREHVTNFIHDWPEKFRTENVLRALGNRSDLRICVDTVEDFAVVENIFRGLGDNAMTAGVEEIIAFLDQHPEIARLNAGVPQKSKFLRATTPS